jgi:hypothetical protein
MLAPPFVANATLSDLEDTALRLECCTGTTYVAIRLLIDATRPNARLRNLLPRLRCRHCGERPTTVTLIEAPPGQAPNGLHAGWQIALIDRTEDTEDAVIDRAPSPLKLVVNSAAAPVCESARQQSIVGLKRP